MESASVPKPSGAVADQPRTGVEDKGLKKNAIGFASSPDIGVASTAPGYSLATTLGFVAAAVGFASPAIEELGQRVTANARRRADGAAIEAELVPKHATEALVAAAEQRDTQMIVVGSGGEGGLKGFILGTTPHKLMHVTERPVLVVHADG